MSAPPPPPAPRPAAATRLPPSSRLARTLPQYVVRAAHEPSVGLHFTASHAHARAAPALAAVARACQARGRAHADAVLDARDAADMLDAHGRPAAEALQRIAALLRQSGAAVKQRLDTASGEAAAPGADQGL